MESGLNFVLVNYKLEVKLVDRVYKKLKVEFVKWNNFKRCIND